ncbi:SRPBCC family protein [Cellulomonas sp. C5510]|uniref:SRPBCC family protein n=1 Tax=Cellulomonas sp. C5510 TaxID=2871170 RepID=UPI001C9514E5|nr:SRPBCC family protein [Cellulomonas sp. C5510]QZN86184.1 SRPBCC family protein [Cellulomonas sp. C5510]
MSRTIPLGAAEAWELVADVRHHGRWVPSTRVTLCRPLGAAWQPRAPEASPEPGDQVEAVTGPWARRGGGGLVDRMRIERFDPPLGAAPGVAVLVKLGPVLLGSARIEVAAAGPGSARVTWSEQVHLRGLPPALTAWAGAAGTDRMIDLVLRRAAREAQRSAG